MKIEILLFHLGKVRPFEGHASVVPIILNVAAIQSPRPLVRSNLEFGYIVIRRLPHGTGISTIRIEYCTPTSIFGTRNSGEGALVAIGYCTASYWVTVIVCFF